MKHLEVLLLAVLACPLIAHAQAWPSRPVTIVVPNPAGGPPDVVARLLSAELGGKLGRPFVIENRGGGSGNIGSAAVAKAAPDGHTMLLTTTGPAAINRIIFKELSYDPERDLAPVGLIGKSALIAVAAANSPAKDLKSLIAYAKANPGKLNVGIPGPGTIGHLTSALLQSAAGIQMTHVPYRGAAPLINDLLGGQLDLSFGFTTGYMALVKEGKIRPIAVTGSRRSEKLPQVATLQELGFAGFEATAWYALFVPAKTPAEVIEKTNALVNAYIQGEKGKQQLADLDMEPVGGRPDELPRFIASEVAKWGPVVRALNITPN